MSQTAKTFLITGLVIATISVAGGFGTAFGQVMNSNSYQIQSDSVNFGGGASDSSNYSLEDTLGEIATGRSSSASYQIRAGYRQMQEVYLALVPAGDVTMSPSLGGITGGTSNGSTTVTVITDAPAGYETYLKASSSPAMQGINNGGTIADYTPAGSDPDFDFSVLATDAEFGFSPEGADVADKYLDDGVSCNVVSGSDTVDSCWGPLTITNELIAKRVSGNHPSGTDTVLKFRLTIGGAGLVLEDTYVATTTITAIAL